MFPSGSLRLNRNPPREPESHRQIPQQGVQRPWRSTCRRFKESGTHLCGLARQRWSQLTEDDLGVLEGNIEQLIGRIQQKTGEGREAIEKFFSEMTSRGSSAVAHAAEAAGQYAHQVGDRHPRALRQCRESGPPPPDGDGGRGLRHRPGGRADRRAGDPSPVESLLEQVTRTGTPPWPVNASPRWTIRSS